MTIRKHLKRRVRERQEKTGEAYTTALAHVSEQAGAQARPRVVVQEQPEVTELARRHGFTCKAFVTDALWRDEGALGPADARFGAVFTRLRELLVGLRPEPGAERLHAALLASEPVPLPFPSAIREVFELQRFLSGVRAGARGVSASGHCVAFDVPRPAGPVTLVGLCVPAARKAEGRAGNLLWLGELDSLGDSLRAGQELGVFTTILAGLGGGFVGGER